MAMKVQTQVYENNDKDWGNRDPSKIWTMESKFKAGGCFTQFVPNSAYEESLEWKNSEHLSEAIPVPKSSPKIMTSSGKGRLASRKKTKKTSLLVHLSPKICTKETSSDKPEFVDCVESCLPIAAIGVEPKKKLEKRNVFQGNKHGILDGGVALVPAMASNSHARAKRFVKKDGKSLDVHELPYTPGSYTASLEDSSQPDISEDQYDNSSTVSCSYSCTSTSSKEEKHELNGLNMTIRDAISRNIVHLATNGHSEEIADASELQSSGAERHREATIHKGKMIEKEKRNNYVKEYDKRNQKVVQFEKDPPNTKMESTQKRGIVKGYTRKGKIPSSKASQAGSLDLCISAKKVEVQKHDSSHKSKHIPPNPFQPLDGPSNKETMHTKIVMNENVIANASFEEGEDEILNSDELLLFSSRNGEHASIRDNVVFQSIDTQHKKNNEDLARQSTELVICVGEEVEKDYDVRMQETLAVNVTSPKTSVDYSDMVNNQHPIMKLKEESLTSWGRTSYELGEKLLNDFQRGNVESTCFKQCWSESKKGMNNISFVERRNMLSQSLDNFRAKFGECEPLDLEKIEIEESPSDNYLFSDFDMLENSKASMDSIGQNSTTMEHLKDENNLKLVSMGKKECYKKPDYGEYNMKEPQRPWSTSCVYDDNGTITKKIKNTEYGFELPFVDLYPQSKFCENSIQHSPKSRLNRLQTLRKAVLKDVSIRAAKHQTQLELTPTSECVESIPYEPSLNVSNPMQTHSTFFENLASEKNYPLPFSKENSTAEREEMTLNPEDLQDTSFSKKYFDSCEKFRNSETLQVLTVVAGCSFTCKEDISQPINATIQDTMTSSCHSPTTSQNYDKLIQGLTKKYSTEDTKSSTRTTIPNSKPSNASDEVLQIEENLGTTSLSLALVPSSYITDLSTSSMKPQVHACKDALCSSKSEISSLNPASHVKEHEQKVFQNKAISKVAQTDRASLSAEKLSSILSYLGQVEESNKHEGNMMALSTICESSYGENSPRTVLDHEDALSIAASSVSVASPLIHCSERGNVEAFQIVRHASTLPATIPVLDGVRKKMQELKEKIICQEARIENLESEKQNMAKDYENSILHEKEKFGKELEARAAEYSMAIQHHLSLNEKMVKDKEMLSEKCCTLTVIVNSTESRFEEKLKCLNERWLKDLSKQKELWSINEKSKREAWMEKKTKELKELTIKGLEPHLENVADKHKQEIRLIEARHAEELRKQLDQQSNDHLKNITQLRDRLLGERDDFIDKERLSAHLRMNEVAERYEQQAIQQRMHVANELTSKLEKVEATRREEKIIAEDLINRLQKEIADRDSMFADHVGRAADKIMQQKEQDMKDEIDKLKLELNSWQQSFDKILLEELKKKEKEIQLRCQKERDEQIELVLEKLDKERDIEIAQNRKNGRSRIEELLGEKRELVEQLKDQETQFNVLKKELIEAKIRAERDLAKANLQITSLQRDSNWQGHLIDQLKQQGEQERVSSKTKEDTLLNNIQEYKVQLEKCNVELQDLKDRKVEELAELEARVKLAILKKDSVIEGLKHQVIVAQKQIQQTEILLQEEQRAIVAEL